MLGQESMVELIKLISDAGPVALCIVALWLMVQYVKKADKRRDEQELKTQQVLDAKDAYTRELVTRQIELTVQATRVIAQTGEQLVLQNALLRTKPCLKDLPELKDPGHNSPEARKET